MSDSELIEAVKEQCSARSIRYVGNAKIGRDMLIWVLGPDCGTKIAEQLDSIGLKHTTPRATENGIGLYITGY